MQRRLIGHRTGEERGAVLFQCDAQLLKPVRPMAAQMALNADLINHWLACFIIWAALVRHFVVFLSRLRHLNDDIPRFAPHIPITVRLDNLVQGITAINDRSKLSRLNQLTDKGEFFPALFGIELGDRHK